ncbi:MAG: DUF2845 domain-containing protein [Gammaproteobacteria bacterium]|nr:DUF2845 domain-containing protein [Gammaproteobacteria bacterium]
MRWALCTLVWLAAWLVVVPTAAGFRCDTDLVGRGMTPLEVLERCGDPEFEQGWTDYRYPGYFVRVNLWTYHLGDNRFRRELMFENGRLMRIETRDKPRGGVERPVYSSMR